MFSILMGSRKDRPEGAAVDDQVAREPDRPRIVLIGDQAINAFAVPLRARYVVSISESASHWSAAPMQEADLFVLEASTPAVGQAIARLRRHEEPPGTPVIVLAEHPDETHHLLAMAAGADDYLPLSASAQVLAAHCESVFRRPRPVSAPAGLLRMGRVRVNTETHQTFVEAKPVPLTRSEFRLLCALIGENGRVVSRQTLHSRCLDTESGTDRAIDTHLATLRRKLGGEGRRIVAVRGVGYRVEA
jgi:DNA-binding response OmpR family regulator